MKNKVPLALLALSLILSGPTFGYVLKGNSWTKNRTVLMHLSLPTGGGPYQDGSSSLAASAEDALNIWNQYLVHMKFAVDRHSILPPADDDANTSVLLSGTIFGKSFGSNVLAVTNTYSRGSITLETDVIFNSTRTFDSYRGPQQSALDFHRIALHEFGHVVGLDHPDQATPKQTVFAIMNSIVSNTDSLQPDDINGAQSIYSSGPDYLNSNPAPNLVNISTRGVVGLGDNRLIAGFIVQGSQPATVILREIGNSLGAFGITDALSDPEIELHNEKGDVVATSDDWIDGPDATTIASYHLDPSSSRESALMATLSPGNYTVVVRAFDNQDGKLTGTALLELYDLHTTAGRAGNLSTRGQIQGGDNVLISGFIVGGNQPKQVILRALGPTLTGQVANPLGDPTLELRNASGTAISFNDNWGDGPDATSIQTKGFAPGQNAESALQITLNPGSYTAIVRGTNNSAGVALVEVYDLSPPPN
ncbi:MAG: hypothetical protein QOH88_2111 [Verrucomicrobiota bacterium]|jgi:hypothetical protein